MKNEKMSGERYSSIALGTTRAHLQRSSKQHTPSTQNTGLQHTGVQKAELLGNASLSLDKVETYTKKAPKSTHTYLRVANRFSTSLVGRGKKGVGCKLLLKSLVISRRASLELRHEPLKEGRVYKQSAAFADENYKGKASTQTPTLQNNVLARKHKTREQHNNGIDKAKGFRQNSLIPYTISSNNIVQQQKGYKLCKTLFSTRPRYTVNKAQRFSGAATCSTSRIAWLCQKAMENVKPIVETRKVRRGGNTYQVPFVIDKLRQDGMAIRWLIESSVGQNVQNKALSTHHTLKNNVFDVRQKKINRLSAALTDSLRNTGQAIDKRNKAHQLALHNRAYMHYRWW